MKRALWCIGICFFAFYYLHSSAWAVTISVSNIPSTIDQSQIVGVDVSLVCSGCNDSFLRGVFYPSGTSYFGYTQDNSGAWNNAPAASCTTFFKIAQSDLVSGTWSGTLKVKLDTSSSIYTGPGEYFFKVGRYTSSCGSPTWSTESTIAVIGPTATPTPAPTSTPTPTPKPTSTPTPTPTNVPTNTPTPTLKLSASIAPSASISEALTPSEEGSTSISENVSPPPTVAVLGSSTDNTGKALIGIGLFLLVSCGILVFRLYKKGERLFL